MKNYFLSAIYRHYKWPVDFEFIESQTHLRDLKDVREHFLFHPRLAALDRVDIQRTLDYLEDELEYLHKKGWKVTYPGDVYYPDEFLHLPWPPIFLSYMGAADWNTHNFISIVGSREPTYDAVEWMENELASLLKSGFGLISGAARGIDQVAHRICIQNQQKTIAFLPTGLKYIYPKDFSSYIPDIVACGGAVMSEYLPSAVIQKHHFHERNRLIASLGRLLLVVQAKIKSGSLLTARYALQSGKPVAAVPWHPLEPKALGTNQLLFDGAQMIRNADDLATLIELELAGEIKSLGVQRKLNLE